jgi:hypothetical protein
MLQNFLSQSKLEYDSGLPLSSYDNNLKQPNHYEEALFMLAFDTLL